MLALTIANVKMLARNRQAAFWALFFPLLLVLVFGLIDVRGVGSGSLYVVDQADTAESQGLVETLSAVEMLDLEPGPYSEAEARRRVDDGDLDYLVIIPRGFAQTESDSPAAVTLLYQSRNEERNQLVDGLVRSQVADAQEGIPQAPLAQLVISEVMQVSDVDYFDHVLMGLIGLGVMANSIISIAVRVSTYRNQAILKRLLVTPLPIWKYFFGEVTAHLAVAAVQVAIIMLVGVFVFGANVHGNVAWIFLIALLGSLVFLNIGFILSAWANSPGGGLGNGQRHSSADDVLCGHLLLHRQPALGAALRCGSPAADADAGRLAGGGHRQRPVVGRLAPVGNPWSVDLIHGGRSRQGLQVRLTWTCCGSPG